MRLVLRSGRIWFLRYSRFLFFDPYPLPLPVGYQVGGQQRTDFLCALARRSDLTRAPGSTNRYSTPCLIRDPILPRSPRKCAENYPLIGRKHQTAMTEVITQLVIPKEEIQWTPYEKRPFPAAFLTDQQAIGGGHTIAEWHNPQPRIFPVGRSSKMYGETCVFFE